MPSSTRYQESRADPFIQNQFPTFSRPNLNIYNFCHGYVSLLGYCLQWQNLHLDNPLKAKMASGNPPFHNHSQPGTFGVGSATFGPQRGQLLVFTCPVIPSNAHGANVLFGCPVFGCIRASPAVILQHVFLSLNFFVLSMKQVVSSLAVFTEWRCCLYMCKGIRTCDTSKLWQAS